MKNALNLKHRRICLIRHKKLVGELHGLLINSGAEIYYQPGIELRLIEHAEQHFRQAIEKNDFDWLFLTSAKAARFFDELAQKCHFQTTAKCAAIGPATAKAATDVGLEVAFTADHAGMERFARQFLEQKFKARSILYPASTLADNRFNSIFYDKGISLTRLNLYQPVSLFNSKNIADLIAFQPEVFVFHSPSAVQFFIEEMNCTSKTGKFREQQFVAIGTTTAEAFRKHAIKNIHIADAPEPRALFKAICNALIT